MNDSALWRDRIMFHGPIHVWYSIEEDSWIATAHLRRSDGAALWVVTREQCTGDYTGDFHSVERENARRAVRKLFTEIEAVWFDDADIDGARAALSPEAATVNALAKLEEPK